MKSITLANKVKKLRTLKGLSQEELAALSQLSLRTIQRIEKSETRPYGDTLKRLAAALNVIPEELTAHEPTVDKRGMVVFYISALSFVVFPLLGPLVPFILWRANVHRAAGHEIEIRRLINFQIIWCVVTFFTWVAFVLFKISHWPGAGYSLQIFLTLYILNFVFIMVKAIKLLGKNNDPAGWGG